MNLFIDIWWAVSVTVFAIGVMDCFFMLLAVATRGGASTLVNVSTQLLEACEHACAPNFFNVWVYSSSDWARMFCMGLCTMLLGAMWLGPVVIIALIAFWIRRWFYLRDVMQLFRGH